MAIPNLSMLPYVLSATLVNDGHMVFGASFTTRNRFDPVFLGAKKTIKAVMDNHLPDDELATTNGDIGPYTLAVSLYDNDNPIFDVTFTEMESSRLMKAKTKVISLMDEYLAGDGGSKAVDGHATPDSSAKKPSVTSGGNLNKATNPGPSSGTHLPQKDAGIKGLLLLHCSECGDTFHSFLKEPKSEFVCKCGHHIDLTANMAKYEFTCPNCEKRTWGHTNLEDAEITVRCLCGSDIDLQWVSKVKAYRI